MLRHSVGILNQLLSLDITPALPRSISWCNHRLFCQVNCTQGYEKIAIFIVQGFHLLSGKINAYILYTKQNKIIFSRILKRHLSQGQRTILSIKLASNNVLSSVSLKKGISCNFHAGVDDSQITFVTIKMATTIGLHKIERNKDSKYIDTKVLYNIHSFISSWNSILPDDNVEQTNSISL